MDENNKLSIKNWALEDRPREKLLLKGKDSLTDAEIIAILLGSGNRTQTAVELAKHILHSYQNNLNELGKKSVKDLMKFKGIGEAKAISIVAALELGRRRKLAESIERKQIKTSLDIVNVFQPILADIPHEEFWVAYLNRASKIITKQKITQGGIAETVVDVRIIMKHALDHYATAIFLCHNHPSGNTEPSMQDINITKHIIKAGELLNIQVLDHIIIADNKYFSFAEENYIN